VVADVGGCWMVFIKMSEGMRWVVAGLAFALVGCVDEENDVGRGSGAGQVLGHEDELEQRADGLMYVRGAGEPFSGVVLRESKGVPRYFASYREGELHGPEVRWSAEGALGRIFDYEFGEKVRDRRYFEDGGRQLDALMFHGKAYGPHRVWHEGGGVAFVGEMLPEVGFHGNVVIRSAEGALVADCIFSHGKYVTGFLDEGELASVKAAGIYPEGAVNERVSDTVELLGAAPVLAAIERPGVGGVPAWWPEGGESETESGAEGEGGGEEAGESGGGE